MNLIDPLAQRVRKALTFGTFLGSGSELPVIKCQEGKKATKARAKGQSTRAANVAPQKDLPNDRSNFCKSSYPVVELAQAQDLNYPSSLNPARKAPAGGGDLTRTRSVIGNDDDISSASNSEQSKDSSCELK